MLEIQVVAPAVEYATVYNKKIDKVSFCINDKSVVISGQDTSDELVDGAQMEVSREHFIKLARVILNQ